MSAAASPSPVTSGPVDEADALARLRLLRSPRVGPVTYFQLLRRFGHAAAALDALPEIAGRGGSSYRIASAAGIEDEVAAVMAAGARYLFHDSPDYPAALCDLDPPPPILTMRGDPGLFTRPALAMVGARNASAAACRLAREWSAELVAGGYVVVSGLARGIDTAAHSGALRGQGEGPANVVPGGTIAVIAGGIDRIYPSENAALQEEIARRGLLIAEMPPGTEPVARHFPWRNRIIAALGGATVVMEAAPRSGSLITARLAGELGREVMAVPGSPLDPRSLGGNQLIRDGAVLVQCAGDIAELLTGFTGEARGPLRDRRPAFVPNDPDCADAPVAADAIGSRLGLAPVAIDEIIRQTGASPGAVHMALVELELAGRLVRHAGGRVSASP